MKHLLYSVCCLLAAFTASADIVKMTPLDTFVDGTNAVFVAAANYTDAATEYMATVNSEQVINGKKYFWAPAQFSSGCLISAEHIFYGYADGGAAQRLWYDLLSGDFIFQDNAHNGEVRINGSERGTVATREYAAATYQPKGDYITFESDPTVAASASAVTSAVPARIPAATIAAFNAALATNGIATLSADATLYDALDRLMQMASRSSPGPVPPEVDPVVVRLDGVVEYYEIGSGADVETVFVYGGLTGEFVVISNPAAVTADILVCGGGGGGGAECSGGGGGGHVVAATNAALVAASYAIRVGAGGNYQGGGWSGNSAAGANGGESSIAGGEIELVAQGGGGGGGATKAASYYTGLLNGGGLGCNNQSPSAVPVRSGGAGTVSPYGSGGGGASDLGNGYAANDGQHLGWGCEGVTSDITGVAQVYGSGGGGGRGHEKNVLPSALDPGKGGTNAGHGNYANSRENCAAPAGFGGGGGGGSVAGTSEYRNGGNGGSGTVIIRVKGKCTVFPEEYDVSDGEED